ncbi:MAG: hypothetical protein RL095_2143 [Verrucomicrobiota bacterium]|jgi:predicted HTH transcriptional regulator
MMLVTEADYQEALAWLVKLGDAQVGTPEADEAEVLKVEINAFESIRVVPDSVAEMPTEGPSETNSVPPKDADVSAGTGEVKGPGPLPLSTDFDYFDARAELNSLKAAAPGTPEKEKQLELAARIRAYEKLHPPIRSGEAPKIPVRDKYREYWENLVRDLRELPYETEWLMYRVSPGTPQEIGKCVSALANSAAVAAEPFAYLIWGIRETSREIVGTRFSPEDKVDGENLGTHLFQGLWPRHHIRFVKIKMGIHELVMLKIRAAQGNSLRYRGNVYIRNGSSSDIRVVTVNELNKLEAVLDWSPFFELEIAAEKLTDKDVLKALQFHEYFKLRRIPLPKDTADILMELADAQLISPSEPVGWNITNIGAILFAHELGNFGHLVCKSFKVVRYQGSDNKNTVFSKVYTAGYAVKFPDFMATVKQALIAKFEGASQGRKNLKFPEQLLQELVINALVHQLLSFPQGPLVEIFEDRIEISNAGNPLINYPDLLKDGPKFRNLPLTSTMRHLGLFKGVGDGFNHVLSLVEGEHLAPPLFKAADFSLKTRIIIFPRRTLSELDNEERIRACYQHACLKWANSRKHSVVGQMVCDYLTNTSLRERFGVGENKKTTISLIIRKTIDAGLIRCFDENVSPKLRQYVPYWADE